ncbi:hypothetical protein F383_06590 [Gossypium arboreum]|uniref:Uncharacterized protein n=1 Tax=Gossypium arboreum TaxID=29729 RepID=A0A0B0PRC2_GOSAR|nr:hypothetical protein F383_06590 [Gossypium arboreum]
MSMRGYHLPMSQPMNSTIVIGATNFRFLIYLNSGFYLHQSIRVTHASVIHSAFRYATL